MFDYQTLAVFLTASFVLLVIPGPAVIFIVGTSLRDGRAGGVVSALGIASGGLVHVAAAVLGLSALLASSAMAYQVVKWLGAGYLVTDTAYALTAGTLRNWLLKGRGAGPWGGRLAGAIYCSLGVWAIAAGHTPED